MEPFLTHRPREGRATCDEPPPLPAPRDGCPGPRGCPPELATEACAGAPVRAPAHAALALKRLAKYRVSTDDDRRRPPGRSRAEARVCGAPLRRARLGAGHE